MNYKEFFKHIKNIKNNLMPKYEYLIEPSKPIESNEEILIEIYKYFQDNDISVISQNPLPIVSINGTVYIARTDRFFGLLGLGKKIDSPYPIRYYGGSLGNIAGFKFIYLYYYNLNKNE